MVIQVSDTSTTTMTGLTGAGGGEMVRILGMNTGLDVDSIVTKMMKGEQTKIDSAKQAEQLVEWKQEGYQSIIADIKTFQGKYFDSMNKDTYVLSPDFFSSYAASSSDDSVATVQAGVGAQAGTYNIVVNNIASAAAKGGANLNANSITSGFTDSNWAGKKIGFSINGGDVQTINLGSTISSVDDAVNNINAQINSNSSLSGKVKVVVNGSNIQFQALSSYSVKIDSSSTTVDTDMNNLKGRVINPSTSTTMAELGLGSDGTLKFNYNGNDVSIDVKTTDKLSNIINNINTATNGNVIANFSQLTGEFTIKTSSTGNSQSLQVESGSSSDVLTALGLSVDTEAIKGKDASVSITPPGGSAVTLTESTNAFAIDGMTYNLSKNGSTSITVTQDADKVYDRINDFVQSYDKVVDEIEEKLGEKKDKNYPPLTDAQKKTMSDDQIKDWNNKAKTGVLRNDDNLQKLLTDFRNAFTTSVSGNILKFGKYGTNAIGIDTNYDTKLTDLSDYQVSKDTSSSDSSYVTQGGKIYIADKNKLMDAIKNHGSDLAKFFTAASDSDDKTQKFNDEGIISRLDGILNNNVGMPGVTLNTAILTKYANNRDDYSIYGASGDDTLPDQIAYKKKAIDNLQAEFKTIQESYYEKFSKLETAMQTLNTQQSMLSSMLGQSS